MATRESFLLGCRGRRLRFLQIILVLAPSYILYGYSSAVIGELLSVEDWTRTFPQIDTIHTKGAIKSQHSTVQGAVVATFTIGGLFGSLACIHLGDVYGRRVVIFASSCIALVGQILECSSFGLAQFVVGRLLLGIGVGGSSATIPVWQSECSPAKNRGSNVVLVGLFISAGYTLTSWISLGMFQVKTGSAAWRVPLGIPDLFALIVMGAIFFLPESPRWLVWVNRKADASFVLSELKDLSVDSPEIISEIAGIELSLEETRTSASSLKDLFTMGDEKLLFRLGLCLLLQLFQEMSGSTVVAIYGTTIFQQDLKRDSQLSRVLTGATLTWKFVAGFVSFFTVDRFGRRPLFIISGVGITMCMLSLVVSTSFPTTNKAAATASVLFIFMFNFFVPIGFLGVNYLYCTEISPIRLRVPMVSISTANHWLWNFVITMVTPVALENLGFRYWIVFTVVASFIPISVFFFYPETVGRNLEEIDLIFRKSKTIFSVVSMASKIGQNESGLSHLQESKTGEQVEIVEQV